MRGKGVRAVMLSAALLGALAAPSAEAACVRPEHIVFYDSGQRNSIDLELATRTLVFRTRDGRELRATGAVVVDDGRRLTATSRQDDLIITMRADLPFGRVRAIATEIKPVAPPVTGARIRSRHRVKNWTVVAYGGPSQEGVCGNQDAGARSAARTTAAKAAKAARRP